MTATPPPAAKPQGIIADPGALLQAEIDKTVLEHSGRSAEELRRMRLPIVGRSEADFRSPFAPSGRFERLRITHLVVADEPDRFWQQYQKDRDATAFAKSWVGFTRAAVFDTLLEALDPADAARRCSAHRPHCAAAGKSSAAPPRPPSRHSRTGLRTP